MRQIILALLVMASAAVYGQQNGATIPVCYGTLMPLVEIQVNNTASNEDDYGSKVAYTVCRARIVNYADAGGNHNFAGGVPVEFENASGATQNLLFSSVTSGGSLSMFQTLPEDGSWLTFYVKGKTINTVDKTSIIELATTWSSCSAVIIARKAMMIGTSPIHASQPTVEIQIDTTVSTIDDYVTWSPTLCRIRWSNPPAPDSTLITFNKGLFRTASYVESSSELADINGSPTTLNVQLQNISGSNRLRFADASLIAGTTAKNSTVTLTLSSDSSWVYFYIAGNFGNASTKDKDAVLEVRDASTDSLLSREATMVRIRKNATKLSTAERDRYLQALKKADLTYNTYVDFLKTHARDNTGAVLSAVASRQSHKASAFLAWHRAFVLEFERELQATDPSVALPYWKFDAAASNIFTSSFMGSNSTTTSNMAVLASTNPIVSWTLPGENVPTGIQRKTPYGNSGHPNTATETATLGLGSPNFAYSSFRTMETSFHNPAHSLSGSSSWLSVLVNAVRDPLFFFLHCNVDHIWAKWQWMRNRYNSVDTLSYDLQGTFNSPPPGRTPSVSANRTLGQYVGDTMWPWDNITGGTSGSASERPQIAVLKPFPITVAGTKPGSLPTPGSTVDYLGITSSTPDSGMGYCYDDFYPY